MKPEQPLAELRAALAELCAAVPRAHAEAVAGARARLERLTKPQGSLGQIEDLIARLAGSTGQICPPVAQPAILLAAADHGVAAEGVSAFPQAVTAQMVRNYLVGGAAINALAAGARRVPVLLDGYITTAAALVAAGLAPAARDHMLDSHCSAEPGHALAHLGLSEERGVGPPLHLELRLGEGSGAALALPLLGGAAQLMRSMATFDQAGVSDRE